MDMTEKAVLTDCLESLKHASENYLRAALECDSDGMRKRLSRLALDKAEGSNSVFNMMHQAGIYKTQAADGSELEGVLLEAKKLLNQMGGASRPVERELGRSDDHA